jgi:hypothetical protein
MSNVSKVMYHLTLAPHLPLLAPFHELWVTLVLYFAGMSDVFGRWSFGYQLEKRLSWLKFLIFPQLIQVNTGMAVP